MLFEAYLEQKAHFMVQVTYLEINPILDYIKKISERPAFQKTIGKRS
jgi:hypothetical protein